MTGAVSTWMPYYPRDYLGDTMHLTTEQHGAYWLLITAYWLVGPLVDDDQYLCGVARLPLKRWKQHRATIERLFRPRDGKWYHKRIDQELERAKAVSEARRASGKKGGEAARGNSGRPANDQQNDQQNNSRPIPELIAGDQQKNTPSHSHSSLRSEDTSLRSVSARKRAKPKTPLPADWELSPQGWQYALGKGHDDNWIRQQSEMFRDRQLKVDGRYADWEAAWRTWVQNAPKFSGNSQGNGHGRRTLSPAEGIYAGFALALGDRQRTTDRGTNLDAAQPLLDDGGPAGAAKAPSG